VIVRRVASLDELRGWGVVEPLKLIQYVRLGVPMLLAVIEGAQTQVVAPVWALDLIRGWPTEEVASLDYVHGDALRRVIRAAHRLEDEAAAELAAAAGAAVRLRGEDGVNVLLGGAD
jgi:hypothetical protein